MESRKRSRTEDGEEVRSKKRAVADEHDSPGYVNGSASDADEPKDGDNLEMFRKDAIYRRMKHYSRENERSQAKIAELERRRSTCEVGLAALEACWTQLIETIRSLTKPEDLPTVDVHTQDIFDLSAHVSSNSDPAYVENLRNKMYATQQLVTAFVQLGGKSQPNLLQDTLYRRCQMAQTECSSLRSEVSILQGKLKQTELEKEQLHENLITAEKRVDRLQSKTLAALQPHASSPVEKDQVKDESPRDTPSSPSPSLSAVNGVQLPDVDATEWKAIAELRDEKIEELQRENVAVREQVHSLTTQLKTPSEQFITESPYYKVLLEQASRLEHSSAEHQREASHLKDEVAQLQKSRQEWQDDFTATHEKALQELRNMLIKRDNDNSRLREQRDQQLSELNERKQKDHVRLTSLNETKVLSETRSVQERIKVLQSEVTRLKTRIAAESCDEDLMTFLFQSSVEEISYIDDLKRRLSAAETRATALENSLSFFQEEHPDIVQHMRNEAEAKQQLAEMARKIQEYEYIFGEALASLPPDVQALTEELRKKASELEKLQLLEKQREQTESSLYAELDKLSAAWEALDRQVKNKVFDLASMEERVTKSGLDKAKSENKFYSAMRDKEAIENERKNLARNLEKQAKVVERLVETEKSLTARASDFEKEVALWKRTTDIQKEQVVALEAERSEWKTRAEGERKRADEIRVICADREKVLDQKRSELRKVEESLVHQMKDAEKHVAKLKTSSHAHGGSTSLREAQLQSEVDKCMTLLKCSTCKMNMRNTVITKCMHSFCKECIESRISTRQRKCPACNISFSQGEVQQLYFQ